MVCTGRSRFFSRASPFGMTYGLMNKPVIPNPEGEESCDLNRKIQILRSRLPPSLTRSVLFEQDDKRCGKLRNYPAYTPTFNGLLPLWLGHLNSLPLKRLSKNVRAIEEGKEQTLRFAQSDKATVGRGFFL